MTDRPQFEWVKNERPGRSITDMEVRHAFLRRAYTPVHAFSYLRDPSFLEDDIPNEHAALFRFDHMVPKGPGSPDMVPNEHVLALREEMRQGMRDHAFCRTRTYTCRYGGLDAEGKPVVTDLQVSVCICCCGGSRWYGVAGGGDTHRTHGDLHACRAPTFFFIFAAVFPRRAGI